jgi:hypothetical protein
MELVPSPQLQVIDAPPTSPEALFPLRDPLAQLLAAAPGDPGSPAAPPDATSLTFVKLTLGALLTNAATLDAPAAAELPRTGASTSKSESDTAPETPITSNPVTAGSVGATTAFAPV